MSKIYILNIWGVVYAFYNSRESARRAGRRIGEPTSTDGKYEYCAFSVEQWTRGKETQKCPSWTYEYRRLIRE